MFICDRCLKKGYDKNVFAMSGSHGRCEDCGKVRLCHDIPSSYLARHQKPKRETPTKGNPLGSP